MTASQALTFHKEERICSKLLIERLFSNTNSHSLAAFPLRVIFTLVEMNDGEVPVQVLVSVPKRCFKHAVKRNRAKRQIREAYRKHKALLIEKMEAHPDHRLLIAFVWIDRNLQTTEKVEQRVVNLMKRVAERL